MHFAKHRQDTTVLTAARTAGAVAVCKVVLLCMALLLFGFFSGYFCENCKILGGP